MTWQLVLASVAFFGMYFLCGLTMAMIVRDGFRSDAQRRAGRVFWARTRRAIRRAALDFLLPWRIDRKSVV